MDEVTAARPSAAPAPLSHKEIVTILIGLMMGMFLAALDQTIVASAMRVIADDLNDLAGQAWVTTAYLITSTVTTPLYGKLGDIYGRKKLFIFAITIFTIGSILCTFAWSIPSLAAFRAVQGIGAGGLFSLALAIIGDIVPPRERAKYQGYFLAVFGTASVIGPVVGGILSDQETILGITGWRWVFLVNVPIAIAALVVVTRTLHLKHTRLDHRVDYWGALTLTITLVPLLIVAEQGRQWGWSSPTAIACYAVGALGFVAFILIERAMAEEALIPLRLFRNRTIASASISSVFIGMGMFGGLAALPLYLQIVKGSSPMEAGLQLLPMTLGIMAGSIFSGQMISRTGRYRAFPIVGSLFVILGAVLLSLLDADSSAVDVAIAVAVVGIGMGTMVQTYIIATQNAVDTSVVGTATAALQFFRSMGGSLAVAGLGALLATRLSTELSTRLGDAASGIDQDRLLEGSAAIPSALVAGTQDALGAALHSVFLALIPIAALGLVFALRLEERRLRTADEPA